ncbi:MAG: hypothetical protein ACW98K_17585 [Candidatus Kariarchaeaceae archaeon]|jgi:uncharacterized integral membrane protein
MTSESPAQNGDFLEKFGYRVYSGTAQSRKSRVWSMIIFEVKSTWARSTFGKVLLVIIAMFNLIAITAIAATSNVFVSELPETQRDEAIRDTLNNFVAEYVSFGDNYIQGGTQQIGLNINMELGILIMGLFAIAGSGLFADDKSGKVTEIYLSRLQKKEYVVAKIGSIIIYINLFLMLPLLIMGALNVQSIKQTTHFDQWDFYLGIILYSLAASLLLGLLILTFSIYAEKRQYASLGFFIFYLLTSIIGSILTEGGVSNEFLLMISPSNLLMLLAYVCLGDFHLGLGYEWDENVQPFSLNDGSGLEWFHVIGVFLGLVIILSSILAYKINKLTTEEL